MLTVRFSSPVVLREDPVATEPDADVTTPAVTYDPALAENVEQFTRPKAGEPPTRRASASERLRPAYQFD